VIVVAREDRVATVREVRVDARVAPEDVREAPVVREALVALVALVVQEVNAREDRVVNVPEDRVVNVPEAQVVPEVNAREDREEHREAPPGRRKRNSNQNQL
jgi:hypothetical protein